MPTRPARLRQAKKRPTAPRRALEAPAKDASRLHQMHWIAGLLLRKAKHHQCASIAVRLTHPGQPTRCLGQGERFKMFRRREARSRHSRERLRRNVSGRRRNGKRLGKATPT